MTARKIRQLPPELSDKDIPSDHSESFSDEIGKVIKMEDKPVLTGDLTFMALADILQLLGSIGDSGLLKITSPYTMPGLIYIFKGDPVNAVNGTKTGIEALNAFFGWTQGRFEFRRGVVLERNVIKKGFMNIILDALRMLDEGKIQKFSTVTYDKQHLGLLKGSALLPLVRGPLTNYSDIVNETVFKDGQYIITEGKFGHWIYIILDGDASVIKSTPRGPLTLLRLGMGSFIGSIRFFNDFGSRTASVIANGDVNVGILDLQRLFSEISAISPQFRLLLASLAARLKNATDQAAYYFDCNQQDIDILRNFTPITEKGQNIDQLFTITNGMAVIVDNESERPTPLVSLSKGDFFGPSPFLNMGYESEKTLIYGSKDIEFVSVDTEKMQQEYEDMTFTLKSMIENILTCLSVTNKLVFDLYNKK
ncbi:MAG: DUF4388 domain-containing protein [Deltaproteobacteria bacterium]|nr:DUF4388 domain-containing protein [Deltaproteobacteria bacterium]